MHFRHGVADTNFETSERGAPAGNRRQALAPVPGPAAASQSELIEVEADMAIVTRRSLLSSAAIGAGGLAAVAIIPAQARAQSATTQPGTAESSAAQPKPGALPDDINTGNLPSYKYALGAQPLKTYDGGSAREVTVAEFPVSEAIAGVDMRLKPGGLRELHWHAIAAEWAYVLEGQVRTTILDPQGRSEILDFLPGDVWYFPKGHAHSIQGIGDRESRFILAFDDGHFSEFGTFSITDWLGHTPPEVLQKNLGIPAATFANFPKQEVYIASGAVPRPLSVERPMGSSEAPPLTHKFQLAAQKPQLFAGGEFRVVSQKEFPISSTMTGVTLLLKPGALRELHWHPNASEWQYFISGRARLTVFTSHGNVETTEFGPGDVGYVPQGFGHYIENIGEDECRALLVLNGGDYQEISLSEWLAAAPRQLLSTNFGVPEQVFAALPKGRVGIAAAKAG
jgi:oxalate decarboxylase